MKLRHFCDFQGEILFGGFGAKYERCFVRLFHQYRLFLPIIFPNVFLPFLCISSLFYYLCDLRREVTMSRK